MMVLKLSCKWQTLLFVDFYLTKLLALTKLLERESSETFWTGVQFWLLSTHTVALQWSPEEQKGRDGSRNLKPEFSRRQGRRIGLKQGGQLLQWATVFVSVSTNERRAEFCPPIRGRDCDSTNGLKWPRECRDNHVTHLLPVNTNWDTRTGGDVLTML